MELFFEIDFFKRTLKGLIKSILRILYLAKYYKVIYTKKGCIALQHILFCRKEATRTPDPYVPNVVRYQLRYFPIAVQNYEHFVERPNFALKKSFPYHYVNHYL